ncbi:hypothetical protein B0T22DRAFT_296444 [Podospora appendiculata]|uniref:Uncharacterized protein n=1 Tax=Podospora appendiculata TaxID=314037 RepID=A0AAE0X2A6_9PEZI|nr:hypothetical protein B0T22DRAFT_296444 [Podospora appendiculata]
MENIPTLPSRFRLQGTTPPTTDAPLPPARATSTDVGSGSGAQSLWAAEYAAGAGGRLAACIDFGLAMVLFIFLGVIVLQWQSGKKKKKQENLDHAEKTEREADANIVGGTVVVEKSGLHGRDSSSLPVSEEGKVDGLVVTNGQDASRGKGFEVGRMV